MHEPVLSENPGVPTVKILMLTQHDFEFEALPPAFARRRRLTVRSVLPIA